MENKIDIAPEDKYVTVDDARKFLGLIGDLLKVTDGLQMQLNLLHISLIEQSNNLQQQINMLVGQKIAAVKIGEIHSGPPRPADGDHIDAEIKDE